MKRLPGRIMHFFPMSVLQSHHAEVFLVSVIVLCSRVVVEGQVGNGDGVADSRADLQAALDYMKKYQGLSQTLQTRNVGSVISNTDIASSIRNMQLYMNVPRTGHIDTATKQKMTQPRCGVPDPSGQDSEGHALGGRMRRYAHTGGKWDTKKLSFRILNTSPDISSRDAKNAIRRAFRVWEEVTPLEFSEVDTGSADMYLSFGAKNHGDSFPFDGPGFTLAHAYPPQGGWGELDGDVHFDEDETYSVSSYDGINLFQVAAHEIGHSLGLAHSSDSAALMAPFYQGYQSDFRLPYDDIMGIQTLYGSRTKPVNPTTKKPQPGPDPGPDPGTPTTKGPDSRCKKTYNAVSLVRGELFAFQEDKYWRLRFPHELISRTAGEMTSQFWQAFPNNIDAAYERYYDHKIFFFKGNKYYKYDGLTLQPGYPQPISDLDPRLPNNLDAVIGFSEYGKTYFIKGRKAWRYDETLKRVDEGYPVNLKKVFPGVPSPVSSAFMHKDGAAYFLKGYDYYRYNDTLKRVEDGYPRRFGVDFLKCDPGKMVYNSTSPLGSKAADGGNGSPVVKPFTICVITSALISILTSFKSIILTQ